MSVIHSEKANCKNCYKCVRVCPVKSIRVENHQAKIIERDCIFCGSCVMGCPQGAKVVSGSTEKVKSLLASGQKVLVSLAPSYYSAFDVTEPEQFAGQLVALGFYGVSETSAAAAYVTAAYYEQMKQGEQKNLITTSCPSANRLIETYYPSLIGQLAPVVSPMIAHGRLLKQEYPDAKVVFVGPCIAKKDEAQDIRHDSEIDAVLTFEELQTWMKDANATLENAQPVKFLNESSKILRMYPIADGILESIKACAGGDLGDWELLSVSGKENCQLLCESLERGELEHCVIELNICEDGCINGPKTVGDPVSRFRKRGQVRRYAQQDCDRFPDLPAQVALGKPFFDRSSKEALPDEQTIRKLLEKIGKDTPEKELNCGTCGYATCRDKVVAVYQNKAEWNMCLPYMRERAESLSNHVLAQSPEIIMIVNEEMDIIEFNTAAQQAFGISRHEALEKNLYELLDASDFERVQETKEAIHNKTVAYPEYGITTQQDILYLENENVVIGMLRDITQEIEEQEQKYKLRMDSMEMAQKVIDKQMVAAQQIAFLLGETTAETKVTLTRLKEMMVGQQNGQDGKE